MLSSPATPADAQRNTPAAGILNHLLSLGLPTKRSCWPEPGHESVSWLALSAPALKDFIP